MRIAPALVLMAVGGILADAVTASIPGLDLNAAGSVLFFTGILWLAVLVGLELLAHRRSRPPVPLPRPDERRFERPTEPQYNPILPPRRPRD
jgi:hypothetical protein